MTADDHERRHFVRFCGSTGERLLELERVVEVIPMVSLIEADHDGNTRYCGLLHYRGRVVPVFDLDDRSKAELGNPEHFLVVARGRERERAIVAREVYGIISVDPRSCSALDTGAGQPARVVEVEGALIGVLDPDWLAT